MWSKRKVHDKNCSSMHMPPWAFKHNWTKIIPKKNGCISLHFFVLPTSLLNIFNEWISWKILACSWNNSNETAFNQTWTLKILKLWFDWSKWNPLFCIWAVFKLIIYQPLWRLLQVRNPSCHQTSSIIRRLSYATCWKDPWKVERF